MNQTYVSETELEIIEKVCSLLKRTGKFTMKMSKNPTNSYRWNMEVEVETQ